MKIELANPYNTGWIQGFYPEQRTPIFVVFNSAQAANAFHRIETKFVAVCVDIPRSRLCTDLAAAIEFFNEVEVDG